MSGAFLVVALISLFTLNSARSFPVASGVSGKDESGAVVGLNLFN